jgi:hypothetical protein
MSAPTRWSAILIGAIVIFVFAYLFDPPAWTVAQRHGTFISRYNPLAGRSTSWETVQVRLDDGRTILARMQTYDAAAATDGLSVDVIESRSLLFQRRSYIVGNTINGL